VIGFIASFPLGALFALIAGMPGADITRVYAFESLGAAGAGLAVSLGLVSIVSNWQGTAIAAGAAAAGVFLVLGRWKRPAGLAAGSILLAAFFAGDLPSQKAWWKPFELIASRDTPYGKLQAVKISGQVSLYASGIRVLSSPDPAAAETPVHFTMLQRPDSRSVLLIGVGVGGGLEEVLKYPNASPDSVELDPEIVRMAEAVLPEKDRAGLRNPRARIHHGDGIRFLRDGAQLYEVIILNLPEPATAQINRFYTREFFAWPARGFGRGPFVVPSSEDSLGPDLRRFLSSLTRPSATFPRSGSSPKHERLPGISAPHARSEVRRIGTRCRFYPSMRRSCGKAEPCGRRAFREPRQAGRATWTLPPAYYFQSVLWSSQFPGSGSGMLRLFARLPAWLLLGLPLLFYALILSSSPSA
jgi:spermidine synthase